MLEKHIVLPTHLSDRNKPYDEAKPLIFMHVPKCSGNSLIQAIVGAGIARTALCGFDSTIFGDFTDFESCSESTRRSIYLRIDDLPGERDFVAAHMSFCTLSRWFPEGQLLTVLREPVARVLSLWLYWRSFGDEPLRNWGREWGDRVRYSRRPLLEFLREKKIACQTDNQLVRLLLHPHPLIPIDGFIDDRHDEELVGAAAERLTQFSFLDIVENPNLEGNLASWLGCPITLGRFNETANIPNSLKRPMADELKPEVWALLDARSRLDLKLWLALAAARIPYSPVHLVQRAATATTICRHSQIMSHKSEHPAIPPAESKTNRRPTLIQSLHSMMRQAMPAVMSS